jgi:glycosyltransferase involved in cell wall biosynthesis
MKLLYLGNKLSKHGLNVTTLETLTPVLENEGFEVITASDKKNVFWRFLDMMITIIKHRKVDYLLIDTYSTSAFWFAVSAGFLAKFLKISYIPILHGGNLPNRLQANRKISAFFFSNAHTLVAPSKYLFSVFQSEGFKRLLLIPNGIEISNYPFCQRTHFQPKLLWVRAFASIYNPKMALEVLESIKEIYPMASLTMVGPDKDGSLTELKKFAKSKNLDVNFTGKLSKIEWIALAKSHDFFINTTHFDNTPVSVIEAMALGLVVVSTNVGGIPYLLTNNETGFLVPDNDIIAMATTILNAIENPSKAIEISEKSRIFAENMDWKIVAVVWKKLLNK